MLEGGPPTDIWSTGGFNFESPLKDLMDRGDYSLEELLGEDELLQELRGMHPQLVDYFGQEAAVQRLVEHVILLEANPQKLEGHRVQSEGAPMDTGEEAQVAKENNTEHFKNMGFVLTPDLQSIRYPYMACEVICCEITSIIDALVDGHVGAADTMPKQVDGQDEADNPSDPRPRPILDLLFSVLYTTPSGQLDDYRAGYLDKILAALCRKRPQAMSTYINDTSGGLKLLQAMLEHLYSHSILQIVQRLLLPNPSPCQPNNATDDCQDDDKPENLFRCKWSESPEAIECLLEALFKKSSTKDDDELCLSEAQNASEVLVTVIQNSPLTSTTMITLTSDIILERIVLKSSQLEVGVDFIPHDSTLTCAMNVLESLVLQLGGYGSVGTVVERGDDDAPPMANADSLVKYLPLTLQNLGYLLNHSSTANWKSPMQFSRDEEQRILGTSRLRIVRLIESLVLLGNSDIDQILCQSKCLETCLDLFWEFEWCSMLHQSVANLLVHVFEGANARVSLQEYFLVKCDLLSRLMESFEGADVESEDYDEILRRQAQGDTSQAMQQEGTTSITRSEDGNSGDSDAATPGEQAPERLPISDDDIDAALEQQKEIVPPIEINCSWGEDMTEGIFVEPMNDMPTTRSVDRSVDAPSLMSMSATVDAPSHIPSLRKGYMGHVIIICQALVHACTTSGDQSSGGQNRDTSQSSDMNGISNTLDRLKDEIGNTSPPSVGGRSSDDEEESYEDSEAPPSSPLAIAHLIHNHPLRERWHEFVTTTLAAETAIQSTPLGGFDVNAMNLDPLHSHRHGQHGLSDYHDEDDDDDDDDADDDDDIPARGLTSGGDVIDMDDNDIEIAASMMEALNMPSRHSTGSDGDDESGDESAYKRECQNTNKYVFDDPLGGNQQFGQFGEDEDSSDEEEDRAAGLGLQRSLSGGADDPPVMDLFAGNFSGENGGFGPPLASESEFSDFANFDDAFTLGPAPPGTFIPNGMFVALAPPKEKLTALSTTEGIPEDIFGSPEQNKDMIDAIFGSTSHSLLLDDPTEGKPKPRGEEDEEDPGAFKPEMHASAPVIMSNDLVNIAVLSDLANQEPPLTGDDSSSEEEAVSTDAQDAMEPTKGRSS